MMDEPVYISNASFILVARHDYSFNVLTDESILVEDGVIKCIGPSTSCSKPRGAYVIDGRKRIVAPAWINAHTHVAMYYLRGSLPDHGFWDWIGRIMKLEEETITPKLVYYSSLLGCIEMIMNGVVGFIDMYYYPVETAKACSSLGLITANGPASRDIKVISETLEELRAIKNTIPIINIHSLYLYEFETLAKLFEYASRNNLLKNIHVSETRREVYMVWKKTGYWPVEYMYRMNWLDDKTILVHLNWVMSHEVEYIAEKNARAVFCPQSSMRLAEAGFAPVYEMLSRGITASIGTDGSSGDRFNMLDEYKQLILLYRHNYWDTRLSIYWAYPRIVINGYRILGLNGGVVEEGYPSYLVVYKYDKIRNNPLTKTNVLPVIVYSDHPIAEYVISNNGIIYSPGEIGKLGETIDKALEWIMDNAAGKIDYSRGRLIG